METKTKIMKTDLKKMVSDYLKNSEKHLFITKNVWEKEYGETYYKVFSILIGEKTHYAVITITGDKVYVSIKDTSWVNTKNYFGMMKNEVFPQYRKHLSVKSYAGDARIDMMTKFDKIKEFIKSGQIIEIKELEAKIIEMMK